MNSWDIFDTILAGADTSIAAGNQPRQIPIRENILKVQPEDIFVSDYEYPDKARHLLTTVAGLRNHAMVTNDGKYTGKVWDMLKEKPIQHTGDNLRADVESPGNAGIHGVKVDQWRLTDSEQYLIDNGLRNLAHACREARLRTFHMEHRGIELLQVNYNFPVLFLASIVLNRMFPTETLLMSSRDCFQWHFLLKQLFDRGHYWYTSVVARKNANDIYHRYINSFGRDPVLVDISGSGNSFGALPQYKSVLMYKPDHPNCNAGVPSMITSKECMRLEQANCAPHAKCIGIDYHFTPICKTDGDMYATFEPIQVQVNAFFECCIALQYYDFRSELGTDDATCRRVMSHLMHQYINFADAVEPLRLLAIEDDREDN